jgi:hypothetical protein
MGLSIFCLYFGQVIPGFIDGISACVAFFFLSDLMDDLSVGFRLRLTVSIVVADNSLVPLVRGP